MKKLQLRLESLSVESFAANEKDGEMGTVHARAATTDCGNETMYVSCNYSACPADCTGFNTDCCTYDPCLSASCGEDSCYVHTCIYTSCC